MTHSRSSGVFRLYDSSILESGRHALLNDTPCTRTSPWFISANPLSRGHFQCLGCSCTNEWLFEVVGAISQHLKVIAIAIAIPSSHMHR